MLVERVAVLNDKAAFEELFNSYYQKLHRFALGIVRDKHIAEDVVSDVFINIWRNRARLIEIDNFSSYIYITTRNIAIRKTTRLSNTQHADMYELQILSEETVLSPEDILLNTELLKCYADAVKALPPRCKNIYQLAKQDGLRYKEIAAILNVSVKTIDAQLAIAIRSITKHVRSLIKN